MATRPILLICDTALAAVADPVTDWTSIDVTLRRNVVSSGQFRAPLTDRQFTEVKTPGRRIVCIRDGQILMSGPVETPGAWKWERDGGGEVTVDWADHMACLGWRLTYPVPTLASDAQNAIAWTITGNAEDSMRALVNLNAGPGALTARRIPGLTLGADSGATGTYEGTTRFEPLLDVLRRIAAGGGDLNFKVAQVGTGLVFTVAAPRHRERQVRYAITAGNVASLETRPEAPKVTVALVGGSGEGVSRPVREVADSSAVAGWGRYEQWVSAQDTDDDDQMDQAGADALLEGGEQLGLSLAGIDGPGAQFGVDYLVGDYVGSVIGGQAVVDLVTAVRVEVTPEAGERITPTIGTGSTKDSATLRAVRAMGRRLGRVERT